MGQCLGTDVKSKYAVGNASTRENPNAVATSASLKAQEAEHATALLSGSLAFCSWVELRVSAAKLRDADRLSKSDPMAVLFEDKEGRWVEAGRTEMIANNLSPDFIKPFKVLYNFERLQRYKVMFVDVDKGQDPKTVSPSDCSNLGYAEFALSEVVAAQGKQLTRQLTGKDGKPQGASHTTIRAEEVANCKEMYRFRLAARGLKNVERFSKSDPFCVISRMQEDGKTWLPVFKTAVRKDNLSPTWDEVVIRAVQLNNGDVLRPLKFEIFDYESYGGHKLIGWCELNTERMQELAKQEGSVVSLQPPAGKSAAGDRGQLQVLSFTVESRPSFLDYLAGGTEIGFIVSVDFTGSNGDPRKPSSKHYFQGGPTQYEKAIMGIGQVLEFYDYDKQFPMYGFGGRRAGKTEHCFPMGPPPDSACHGIQGMLQAYRQALYEWDLHGPTLFAPSIRNAASVATTTQGAKPPKYTCLLILTDGAIGDMDETVRAIIDAAAMPMSILIVGIGREDFGNMHVLDSDDKKLSDGLRVALRDIVQFVEFEKFAGDGVRLAQELLAELPGQLLEYMKMNNIACPPPLPPPPALPETASAPLAAP